ncbi:MAG TPA: hypothetical protein VGP13_02590 [Candidatus Paceibacterota bacterium]|jgi:hypothetical protein|nr:hypothetical protein [Candidatus Paceibacterota bacterium]
MADEEKKEGESATSAALTVLGVIALLIVLWFANGGPQKADLRGIFLAPPAPLGSGEAYGPQVGQPNPNIQQ